MKLGTLATLGTLVTSTLIACSTPPEDKVGSSEHAAVSDVDHMIRRPDGSFDVYCADGSVEHNVPASKITANDVCHGGATPPPPAPPPPAAACPGTLFPPAAEWKAPAPSSTICTPADIALLQTQAQQPNASFSSLEGALYAQNMACAQCVFTTDSDATWGPFVYIGTTGDAFVNWGACFARATGGSDACGAAFHKSNSCAEQMCGACTTQDTFSACYDQVSSDSATCGFYDVNTSCGGNFPTLDQACATVWDTITSVCGGN